MHKRTACIKSLYLYLYCELPICTMSEQEDIVPRTVIVDESLRKYEATSAMEAIRYILLFSD